MKRTAIASFERRPPPARRRLSPCERHDRDVCVTRADHDAQRPPLRRSRSPRAAPAGQAARRASGPSPLPRRRRTSSATASLPISASIEASVTSDPLRSRRGGRRSVLVGEPLELFANEVLADLVLGDLGSPRCRDSGSAPDHLLHVLHLELDLGLVGTCRTPVEDVRAVPGRSARSARARARHPDSTQHDQRKSVTPQYPRALAGFHLPIQFCACRGLRDRRASHPGGPLWERAGECAPDDLAATSPRGSGAQQPPALTSPTSTWAAPTRPARTPQRGADGSSWRGCLWRCQGAVIACAHRASMPSTRQAGRSPRRRRPVPRRRSRVDEPRPTRHAEADRSSRAATDRLRHDARWRFVNPRMATLLDESMGETAENVADRYASRVRTRTGSRSRANAAPSPLRRPADSTTSSFRSRRRSQRATL